MELTKILKGFGYDSLGAFAHETGCVDTATTHKAWQSDHCTAEAQWPIDYMLLSGLMAEHFDGRDLPVQTADALADSIVRKAPDTAIGPYRIRRTIADQRTAIPPTEEGARETYVVTAML